MISEIMKDPVAPNRMGSKRGPTVLRIRDFRDTIRGDYREISAEIDGDRVFYRAPLWYKIDCRAEPFIGIALLEAMVRKVDIEIEASVPISGQLSSALPEIQRIYACWNSDLRPISIHARTKPCEETLENAGSFYSAGVDGSFTLCHNLSEITHLIMLGGFEVSGNTRESWLKGVQANTALARALGKKLVPVETNAKEWTDKRRIHWAFAQGLALASMGPLLRVKHLYVASSHTYNELFPWGSHPLTDPMWTTETTTVIHDGAAFRRGDKMKELRKHPLVLNNLKACWYSIHENCGKCPKCVRTMAALFLLGASSTAFPKFEYRPGVLKSFQAQDKSGASFLEDAIILAKEAGNAKIHGVLRGYHRRYQMRQIAKILDRYLLGGRLRRRYRLRKSLNPSSPKTWRVEVRGAEDWDV